MEFLKKGSFLVVVESLIVASFVYLNGNIQESKVDIYRYLKRYSLCPTAEDVVCHKLTVPEQNGR